MELSTVLDFIKFVFAGVAAGGSFSFLRTWAESRKMGAETKQIDQNVQHGGRAFEAEQMQKIIDNLVKDNETLRAERENYRQEAITTRTREVELHDRIARLQDQLNNAQAQLANVQIELDKLKTLDTEDF